MKKYILIILTSLTYQSFSQLPPYELPLYQRAIPNEGQPVAHRYLGEQRTRYSKRVHRVIDARMKQNKDLAWPKNPLNGILYNAVLGKYGDIGKPKAYKDDSLRGTLSKAEILEKGSYEEIIMMEKPPGSGNFEPDTFTETLDINKIVKFRLMEDWIFDAQHSDLRPRIIAIAPLYNMVSQSGIPLGEAELFWVKMEELRPILAQQEVFNKRNDAARLSYDHWFEMRLFSSYIVKESNVYDVDIAYQEAFRDDGMEALLEGDRIKNDLFVMEHDLWEY